MKNKKSYKIDIISDMHVDFWIKEKDPQCISKHVKKYVNDILKPKGSDILIIAGDLGHYFSQDSSVLLELLIHYKNIFIVPGNHDLYLFSKSQQTKYKYNSFNRIKEMKDFCLKHSGLHYLDGEIIDIDGLKIGGTGYWYNLPSQNSINLWNTYMNDSVNIIKEKPYKIPLAYSGYYYITGFDTQEYYNSEKEKLSNFIGNELDVLVTHVIPFKIPDNKLSQEYINDPTNIFYMSDDIEIVKKINPKVCVFGHTHKSYDFEIDNIWAVCNPLGYKSERTNNEINQIEIYK